LLRHQQATHYYIVSFPTRRSSDLGTRTLIRVTIEDSEKAERRVSTLMGSKVDPRRQWIEDNVEFTLGEDGSILDTNVGGDATPRSEEHTSELQSRFDLVCRLLLEK